MNLPAELRLLIYKHLFCGVEFRSVLVQPWQRSQVWYWIAHGDDGPRRHTLALLRTNRLIHTEASLLPYKLGTFVFDTPVAISLFFRACSSEQIAAIRKVRTMVAYARRWRRHCKPTVIGARQNRNYAETWPRFVGLEDLQVIPRLFASGAERCRQGEEISGRYTEIDKQKMAELLVSLRDELRECMPRLGRFNVGTVLEGAAGTEFVKEMEERMGTCI